MKALTGKEMASLDAAMIKLGIDVPRMMEHAGLYTAIVAARMCKGKGILAMCGTGNNGGDALVAARNLINWGYKVDVAFANRKLKPIPASQWKILKKMNVKSVKNPRFRDYGLVMDGLLGYRTAGNPRGRYALLIEAANDSKVPILAIDLPSGLDATTGKAYSPCIKAKTTLSLTAAKKGLLSRNAGKYTGKILVSYMAVPEIVARKFGLKADFSENNLISQLR